MTASFNNEIKRLNANSQYPLCGKQQGGMMKILCFYYTSTRFLHLSSDYHRIIIKKWAIIYTFSTRFRCFLSFLTMIFVLLLLRFVGFLHLFIRMIATKNYLFVNYGVNDGRVRQQTG